MQTTTGARNRDLEDILRVISLLRPIVDGIDYFQSTMAHHIDVSNILNCLLLFYQQHTRSDSSQVIVAITTERFYDLFSSRLGAVVREDSVISHLALLVSALGHICDKAGNSIHNIMYTELSNQRVRTTMLSPRLQKELRVVCKIVDSIRGGIVGLLFDHCYPNPCLGGFDDSPVQYRSRCILLLFSNLHDDNHPSRPHQ